LGDESFEFPPNFGDYEFLERGEEEREQEGRTEEGGGRWKEERRKKLRRRRGNEYFNFLIRQGRNNRNESEVRSQI
jgi:hypothetical protein